jgi:apolipoprotein N-acyltransferase
VQVPFGFETDLTVYSRYGDWFAWLCALATSLLLLLGVIRKTPTAQSQVN